MSDKKNDRGPTFVGYAPKIFKTKKEKELSRQKMKQKLKQIQNEDN